jgi:DNA repair protein RecO (recombination protein O)
MEWQDSGIVLSVRPHGETSAIVELFTRHNGRHAGLVKGGRSRLNRPILQTGNVLRATWRARLEEHLGFYTVEAEELRAARLMESRSGTLGLSYVASLARLLPERDPHPELFDIINHIIGQLDNDLSSAALMVRLEMRMLAELGFGLDVYECALTGTTANLSHVSPKSGRAVCAEAAAPWVSRLLPLPSFLQQETQRYSMDDIKNGINLTGFFLNRHIYEPRNLKEPEARARYFSGFC